MWTRVGHIFILVLLNKDHFIHDLSAHIEASLIGKKLDYESQSSRLESNYQQALLALYFAVTLPCLQLDLAQINRIKHDIQHRELVYKIKI